MKQGKLLCTLLLMLLAGCTEQQHLGELMVCLGERDMPRAIRQDLAGFDYDFSVLLADRLHRKFTPVWLETPNPSEIESTDIDYTLLSRGACDIQPSIPGLDAIAGFDSLWLCASPRKRATTGSMVYQSRSSPPVHQAPI